MVKDNKILEITKELLEECFYNYSLKPRKKLNT